MRRAMPNGPAWALVPVKRLEEAKSRLSPELSAPERHRLQRQMLRRVVSVLRAVPELAGVAVISADPQVERLVAGLGAHPIAETGPRGLNPALGEGAARLEAMGAELIAVIPADLPELQAEDVGKALEAARESGAMQVVPDMARTGTNGLFFFAVRPPCFRFGPDSFRRHLSQEGARALSLASLARDIDRPADLAALGEPEFKLEEETSG